MIAFLLAAQLTAASVPCQTVQPSPAFVCHNGQWLPPNHPLLPPPEPVAVPDPMPCLGGGGCPIVLPVSFQVGHTYRRDDTGTELYIMTLTATRGRIAVYVGECLNQRNEDQCWYPGALRLILANANTLGWTPID